MRKIVVIHGADPDDIETWLCYRSSLCDDCHAVCCSLPAELRMRDLVRLGVIDEFDLETDPKVLA